MNYDLELVFNNTVGAGRLISWIVKFNSDAEVGNGLSPDEWFLTFLEPTDETTLRALVSYRNKIHAVVMLSRLAYHGSDLAEVLDYSLVERSMN